MPAPASRTSPAEGLLRLTWVTGALTHLLEHAGADEPAGTWTGLACPDQELPIGSDVDTGVLKQICADGRVADLIWEPPDDLAAQHAQAFIAAMIAYESGDVGDAEQHWNILQTIWSRAWTANCAALGLMQEAGITRFAPAKPQRWVIASFEHHCGPHGVPTPHIHNIVALSLTCWRDCAISDRPLDDWYSHAENSATLMLHTYVLTSMLIRRIRTRPAVPEAISLLLLSQTECRGGRRWLSSEPARPPGSVRPMARRSEATSFLGRRS